MTGATFIPSARACGTGLAILIAFAFVLGSAAGS